MKHALLLVLALPACGVPDDPLAGLEVRQEDPSDLPLADLDAHWRDRFARGDAVFERTHRAADGLGPLYIRAACASCHADDARGPGAVTKLAGAPLPWGPTVRAQLAAGATVPVGVPDDPAVVTSVRLGPAVFGRGYLEAIDDAEIERVEAEQARAGVVSGRVHRVCRVGAENPDQPFHDHRPGDCDLIGRFGFKARLATLDDFSADAFVGDMGLTSPLRPDELPNPEDLADDERPGLDLTLDAVNLAADYVRLLAIPARPEARVEGRPVGDGPALFAQAGCATCHVPRLRTRADYPIPALAGVDAEVYTDVLLHDLGDALADGVQEGLATGREWRTAPLIGLRHLRAYLHDGRARTLEDAVLAHDSPGSEAATSVAAWRAFTAPERARLRAWLETL
ncbi:MAG: hypothetical protein H6706_26985 [Myxococcales bacterium]|nr:hypothetical protein [Myxococcales bacterium]